jgi:Putative phage serine protease XkdF
LSAGHATVPESEEGILPSGLRSLITPEIFAIVAERVARAQIERRDVPLVAGASEDNKTVYIDRRVEDEYEGRSLYGRWKVPFRPADTLPWHELGEQYFEEELGLGYLAGAHPIGDWFERHHVEQVLGIAWDSYQEIFDVLIPICRAHKPVDFPHDIRKQPYVESGDPELIALVAGDDAAAETQAPTQDGLQAPAKYAVLKTATARTGNNVRSLEKGDGEEQEGMSDFRMYLPIDLAKVDKQQQMVWGFASTPTLDLDNEIVKLEAIEEALPDYMEWRNIREMHQPSAVGVTKEATVKKDGLYIGAKIVDQDAWQKVVEGVYKGFSIGGRTLEKLDNEITKLRLTEISLVDRPANPDCKIEVIKVAKTAEPTVALDDKEKSFLGTLLEKLGMGKREFSQKERDSAADSGAALPDGSFPIHNKSDLHNAIQAHGRAKDKDKAKAHIKSRAASLGATDMLPDDWKVAGTDDLNKRAAAFEKIREAQRYLVRDETIENDSTDLALVRKLGHIAQDLALAMGDADDKSLPSFDEDGELEMAASPDEIRKRVAAAHKEAIHKAMHHLTKAGHSHKGGFAALKAAHKMCKALAAGDIEKGESTGLIGHLSKAHEHFSDAQDHHDMASSHLGKASHAWGSSGIQEDWGGEHDMLPSETHGSLHEPSQPTEGHVPIIDADEVYPGKAAKGSISKAEHDALLAAAVAKAQAESLQKQVDLLSRAPAGSPRARAFAIGKDAFPVGDFDKTSTQPSDPMAILMKGMDTFDMEDPDQRQRAFSKAVANMIGDTLSGGGHFAKSVLDPGFRGAAARGR